MKVFEVQGGPDCLVVRFSGRVDSVLMGQVRQQLMEQIPASCTGLVVDLRQVAFIDSHAVGLFAGMLRRVHDNKGRLVFTGAQGQPAALLRMVGFDTPSVSFCDEMADAQTLCAQRTAND